ncbi:MAG: hypothetical protein B6U69_01020 [Thermofilum sp. ex4484_15]|nr:MAG: hypothetical protein B6U69_01020 [Thermofilum sp. ex4484_15]
MRLTWLLLVSFLALPLLPAFADPLMVVKRQAAYQKEVSSVTVKGYYNFTERLSYTYGGGGVLSVRVVYNSILGTLHLSFDKVIDIAGNATGANLKESFNVQYMSTGGKLQWIKSYGNSAMHAAIGEAGTVTELNEADKAIIWATVGTGEDFPRMEYHVSKTGKGFTSTGAIWYWNPNNPAEYFFSKEVINGTWSVSKSIVFDYYSGKTPPVRPSPKAP